MSKKKSQPSAQARQQPKAQPRQQPKAQPRQQPKAQARQQPKAQPRQQPKAQSQPKAQNKQNSQQAKPKDLLKKFTEKGKGNQVNVKEVKRVIRKTSAEPGQIRAIDKRRGDVKLSSKAKDYLNSLMGTGAGTPEEVLPPGGGGTIPQDDGTGIFGPISAHEKDIANIYADADKYVADAYSGAQVRSAELGLEGTKYSADKESEWRQAVANIEVKGRLDLQPIINAGLEKVAGIEAQASRDVADITGKYNVEGIKTRGEFDEKIGKINLAGSMYGLISSAFG